MVHTLGARLERGQQGGARRLRHIARVNAGDQPLADGRRTVYPRGCVATWASIAMCHANGGRIVGGPIDDTFTTCATPTVAAASIKAISLHTWRGEVPCTMQRRCAPCRTASNEPGWSKSTATAAVVSGSRAVCGSLVKATTLTGSATRLAATTEPMRPVAPASAMRPPLEAACTVEDL